MSDKAGVAAAGGGDGGGGDEGWELLPSLRVTKAFDFDEASTDDWGPASDTGAEANAKGGAFANEAANDELQAALGVELEEEVKEADGDDRDGKIEANGLATVEENTEGATLPPGLPNANEPETTKGGAGDELEYENAALEGLTPALGGLIVSGTYEGDDARTRARTFSGNVGSEVEVDVIAGAALKAALLLNVNDAVPVMGDEDDEPKNEKAAPDVEGNDASVPNEAAKDGKAIAGVDAEDAA